MKWKSKTHEFDKVAKNLHKQKLLSKRIYIFGAGEIGRTFAVVLQHFNLLKGFIDNNIEKQGLLYVGYPISSLQNYIDATMDYNSLIVLCVKEEYCLEIISQLAEYSLIENKDFMIKDEFEKRLRISLYQEKNIIYLPLVQISLTERCTLRCKKCAHACNCVTSNKKDLSLEEVKESADYFFKYVDYISEFVLIGGEPFLYKELKESIDYIATHYRGQMGTFSITTNGTILPSDVFFELCQKYDVMIRISNYAETLPWLGKKMKSFEERIKNYKIPYRIGKLGEEWTDYGFDYVDRQGTPEELEEVFDKCWTPCHEIRKSKFYFCVMARSVAENMGLNIGKDDFFDLAAIKSEAGKKEFFEYTMGYSEKGYLDMCNYCHGVERMKYPIPAGEQMR